jgi:hypothetical protein
MVVMMVRSSTRLITKGIFKTSLIIKYFVDQAFVQKGFQRAIDCHPVQRIADFFFDIAVR